MSRQLVGKVSYPMYWLWLTLQIVQRFEGMSAWVKR